MAGSTGGAKRQSLSKLIVNQGGKASRLHVIFFFLSMTRTALCPCLWLAGQTGHTGGWQLLQNLCHLSKRLQAVTGDWRDSLGVGTLPVATPEGHSRGSEHQHQGSLCPARRSSARQQGSHTARPFGTHVPTHAGAPQHTQRARESRPQTCHPCCQ